MPRLYQPTIDTEFKQLWETIGAKFASKDETRPYEAIILDAIENGKLPQALADFKKINVVFDEVYTKEEAEQKYGKDAGIVKMVGFNNVGSLNYFGLLMGSPDRSLDNFFAILFTDDGKKLRAYVPYEGNTWDNTTKDLWDKSLGRNPRKFDADALYNDIQATIKERDLATAPKRVMKPKAAPVPFDMDAFEASLNEGILSYDKIAPDDVEKTFAEILKPRFSSNDFSELIRMAVRLPSDEILKDVSKVDVGNHRIAVKSEEVTIDSLKNMMGIQTIGDLSFIGVVVAMPWQYPVFFILYVNNGEIRAYVPNRGNSWDLKKMCAWGGAKGGEKGYNRKNIPNFDDVQLKEDITKRFNITV